MNIQQLPNADYTQVIETAWSKYKSDLVSDVGSKTIDTNTLPWQPRDVIVVQPIILEANGQPLDPVR